MPKKIIKEKIYDKNKTIIVERDKYWNMNVTLLAKSYGKNWQDWYKYFKKKKKIKSDNKYIVEVTAGRNGSTWGNFDIVIHALNSWSQSGAYQLICLYRDSHGDSLQKRISKLELLINNQKKRKRRYLLRRGPCIYCYTTNNLRKVGFSSGTHKRIRNHETSVGNFAFDWVFFLGRAKRVEEAVLERFVYPKDRPKNNREHFTTSAKKLRKFVISYIELMEYSYKEMSAKELKSYADSV